LHQFENPTNTTVGPRCLSTQPSLKDLTKTRKFDPSEHSREL